MEVPNHSLVKTTFSIFWFSHRIRQNKIKRLRLNILKSWVGRKEEILDNFFILKRAQSVFLVPPNIEVFHQVR